MPTRNTSFQRFFFVFVFFFWGGGRSPEVAVKKMKKGLFILLNKLKSTHKDKKIQFLINYLTEILHKKSPKLRFGAKMSKISYSCNCLKLEDS